MPSKQSGFSHVLLIIFFGLIFIGVIFVGWRINNSQQLKSNDAFFKQLTIHAQQYWVEQSQALGVNGEKGDVARVCYRTEQGPFDNGNLWCGLQVEKKITVQPDSNYITQLLGKLGKAAKSQGFHVYQEGMKVDGNDGVSFDAGKQEAAYGESKCSSRVDYSPSTNLPDAKTSLTYKLDCSKRALRIPPEFHCQSAGDASEKCVASL